MRAHILVVDDDPDVRLVVAAMLESADYRVSAVKDLETAHAILRNGAVDVVISDILLYGGNGDALTSEISGPIILMSGDLKQIDEHREPSAVPFLAKPFRSADLFLLVAEALSTRCG